MSSESGDTDEEVNTGESSSSGDQGDEDCVTENEIKPPKLLKSKVVLESTLKFIWMKPVPNSRPLNVFIKPLFVKLDRMGNLQRLRFY